jgi:hypothetical protein
MIDDQEADEREVYNALDASKQKAIRFLLDCAASPQPLFQPVRFHEWLAERGMQSQGVTLAAYNELGIVRDLAAKLATKENWTDAGRNADVFFGGAVKIAIFCRRNEFIRTFAAFDFLFVRLFGGAVRPLTPSLFAAALLHPDVFVEETDARELESAMMARLTGWGTHEPVWFPNHPIPPFEPIPPYPG